MATVWFCGVAPSQHSSVNPDGGQVPWCSTRSGGAKLRAAFGSLFERAKLRNAGNVWLGKARGKDKEPEAALGVALLLEIAVVAAESDEDHLVVAIGISYWRKVFRLAAQNHGRIFSFCKDPVTANTSMQAAFNVVGIALPNGREVNLQLSYLPHTMHWSEVVDGEGAEEYRRRTADLVASKPDLTVTADDLIDSFEEIDVAFGSALLLIRDAGMKPAS